MKRDKIGLMFSDLERMLKAENPNIPDDIMITRIDSNSVGSPFRLITIEYYSKELVDVPDSYEIFSDTIGVGRYRIRKRG